MKKRIIAIFFTVLFCMSLVILPSYSEEISNNDTQQYATGRIPTSEEQLAAFKKPENEIGEVKLNAEALAEVKQETSSPSMFSSLQPAEPGREILSEAELENYSTVLTTTMETLPKACDNSSKEFFPSIKSQEQTKSCVSWALGYYQTVSYTHLDVYKRQYVGRGRIENRYFEQRYSGELSASHKQDKATSCQRKETENRHLRAFTAVHGFADFRGNSWYVCFQRLFQRLYPCLLYTSRCV